MAMLVTYRQAADHLRLDSDDGEDDIRLKIMAASGAVLNYLGVADDYYTDSAGANTAPATVQAATLILVGEFDANREGGGDFASAHLPASVRALLGPLRDPVVS